MTSYMRQNGNKIIRPNVLNKVTQRYLYQNKKTSSPIIVARLLTQHTPVNKQTKKQPNRQTNKQINKQTKKD